jgi:hypothetical protein
MSGLGLVAGTFGLVLATAALLDAARLVALRCWRDDLLVLVLGTVVLATSAVVVILEVAGVLGLLQPVVVIAGSVATWVAARVTIGRGASGRGDEGARLRPRPGMSVGAWVIAGLALVTVGILLATFAEAVRGPRPTFDVMSGHLPVVAQWLQAGHMRFMPYVSPASPEPQYPANSQLIALWLTLPVHRDFLAQLATLPGLLMLSGGVALVARELGAKAPAALTAALIVPAVPFSVGQLLGTNMTDMLAAGATAAAGGLVAYGVSAKRRPTLALMATIGAAAGLAIGPRYAGLVAVAPVFLVLAAWLWRRGMPGWPAAAAALAGGLVTTGAFFYVRNILLTGDPIYPQSLPWHHVVTTETAAFPLFTSYLGVGFAPGDWAMATGQAFAYGGPLVPLLAAAATIPPVLAAVRRERDLIKWTWALVPLIELAGFVALPLSGGFLVNGHLSPHGVVLNIRYAMPTLAFSAALMAAEVGRLPRRAMLALLVLVLVAAPVFALVDAEKPLSPIALALGGAAAAVLGIAIRLRPPVRVLAVGTLAAALLLCAAAPSLAARYDRRRDVTMPFEDAQRHLGASDTSVAAAGFCEIYALYGQDLQRRVEYLTGRDDGINRPYATTYEDWAASLRSRGVRAVVVGEDACFRDVLVPQREWVREHPETFAMVYRADSTEVYEVSTPAGR